MRRAFSSTNTTNQAKPQYRRAIVVLYRTALRLTRDAKQLLGGSRAASLPPDLLFVAEELAKRPETCEWIQNMRSTCTVGDLAQFVRTSFRGKDSRSSSSSGSGNTGALEDDKKDDTQKENPVSIAMEGVLCLDQFVQKVKEFQANRKIHLTYPVSDTTTPPPLHDDSSSEQKIKLLDSMKQVDEWALQWIDNADIEWLPPIPPLSTLDNSNDDNKAQESASNGHPVTTEDPKNHVQGHSSTLSPVLLPCFPLSGAFYKPNLPLDMFSSQSYQEPSMPGDSDVTLQIFEPRYRSLYQDLLLRTNSAASTIITTDDNGNDDQVEKNKNDISNRRNIVVPFAHPCDQGRFATVGLLYQVTGVQEVADQTQGQFQFICQHRIHPEPVQISCVFNPRAYHTRDTYLQVQGHHPLLDSIGNTDKESRNIGTQQVKHSFPRVEKELELMSQAGHGFAGKALRALRVQGLWGFLRLWCACLQERLLQTELKLAAQIKLLEQASLAAKTLSSSYEDDRKDDNNHHDNTERILRVQKPYRQELLSLQLELALTIPCLLHQNYSHHDSSQNSLLENGYEPILIELIKSEKARKEPYPRRRT